MPLPPHKNLSTLSGEPPSPRPPPAISNNVANGPRAEPLDLENTPETQVEENAEQVDHISQRLSELQEELFVSLKEDIAEWIVKTLGDVDISAENFIQDLDNGVILCRLSLAIEKKAKAMHQQGSLTEPLPSYKLHCNKNARSATWFARDNTTNFLGWCRAYGMIDETLFDSEDLGGSSTKTESPPPAARQSAPPPPPTPTPPASRKDSVVSTRSSTVSTLDSEVNRVSHKCKCQEYVNKLSEGVYDVFGKRVFIRLLKGRHLMVRVGGGWDTFENYLLHHDPVQVFEFHNTGGPHGPTAHSYAVNKSDFGPGSFNGYLVIRSKYKSKNFVS
ncbi:growth arrest-specific protein 2 [Aplysia californica]|uniref:Growth arrest-specific protein 2 n=1 Tax=Aplysia californica TaxID=6500 RepID=A0ABM1W4F5_APLCA|nr:growth arrest-specific protein 2 [Aplysia californica]